MDLFTYGSLMFPQVWEAVTGKQHTSKPGTLQGYIRRTVSGASFPGILFTGEPDDEVEGVIYRDVENDSLARLDEFESDFYIRQEVAVKLADDNNTSCWAYVVPAENAGHLSTDSWSRETFENQHLRSFLSRNFS